MSSTQSAGWWAATLFDVRGRAGWAEQRVGRSAGCSRRHARSLRPFCGWPRARPGRCRWRWIATTTARACRRSGGHGSARAAKPLGGRAVPDALGNLGKMRGSWESGKFGEIRKFADFLEICLGHVGKLGNLGNLGIGGNLGISEILVNLDLFGGLSPNKHRYVDHVLVLGEISEFGDLGGNRGCSGTLGMRGEFGFLEILEFVRWVHC